MNVHIEDPKVDPDWLECTLQDLWDMVKSVRKRSGPKRQTYSLWLNGVVVDVQISRRQPAAQIPEVHP
jgi:hypothetical protein